MRNPVAPSSVLLLACVSVAACTSSKPCRTFSRCDIRTAECRSDVWREAQCARAISPSDEPPVRIIDPDAFRAELEELSAADPPTTDDLHLSRALSLMGLVPADTDLRAAQIEARVASTAAYYDPEADAITIIDRGVMSSAADVATLEHEMIHAIQDRVHDLGAFLGAAETTDEEIARSMVVEGEATTHMLHYYAIASGIPEYEIDWPTSYQRFLESARTIEPGAYRWYVGRSALLYPLGGRAMTHEWLADPASVPARFDAPPASALEFFFDPFASEPARTRPGAPLCEASVPSGARVVHDDRLGPALLYAFAAEPGLEASAFGIARGWQQDRLTVIASADELHTALLWRVQLGAAEIGALWSSVAWWDSLPRHESLRLEAEVVFLASDDRALLDAWRTMALGPCP